MTQLPPLKTTLKQRTRLREMLTVNPTFEDMRNLCDDADTAHALAEQVAQLQADRAALIDALASRSDFSVGDFCILHAESPDGRHYWYLRGQEYDTPLKAIEAALLAGKEPNK